MDRILLVEDSKSFAAVITSAIQQCWQLEVVTAFNLQECRECLQDTVQPFALAIVDINLPDAPDGKAVDVALACHIPCIVFTSQLSDALRARILEKGAADYVLKQGAYNIDYVVNMVGRLLKNRGICTLVVSGDEEKRNQVGRWLTMQNLQVLDAGNGTDALQVLAQEKRVQVLIVDFALEDIPSYSLVAKVRETRSADELAIIGIYEIQQPAVAVHFIKSGANDVLVYPFQPEELHCRVNRSLEQIEHFHQLIELNRQKNRLMGMAAHDIRGPVGNMGAACRMLRSDKLKPERRAELLDMVERASADLMTRLNDLLDVSAIESGQLRVQPVPMDLRELLRQRVTFFEPAAEQKDMRLEAHLPVAPLVLGDGARLGQVIDNLLSNAIKFSPRGSRVQVRLQKAGSEARVLVIDEGVGIPAHEADRLFRAFSRTSASPTGGESSNGLGLAICRNIVNQHGGEIGLESSSDSGSTFCFTVPLAQT